MAETLIELSGLTKIFGASKAGAFTSESKGVKAVDGVSLSLKKGEILGLVGESGSGKTTLVRLILGLIAPTSGSVKIDGQDIARLSERELRKVRSGVAVVFQDPASNLDPKRRVGKSIMRPLMIHGVSRAEAERRANEAMDHVKLDRSYLKSYPHELSGGQQQRIAIARALVMRPKLMVLDEPTSALDISVQAQILNLLLDLQKELDLTYIIVTHDLNVIRYVSDSIAVMYLGRLMERGDTEEVFSSPKHPYTEGLLSAAPVLDPTKRGDKEELLSGEINTKAIGEACCLAPRCPFATDRCRKEKPADYDLGNGHTSACFLHENKEGLA